MFTKKTLEGLETFFSVHDFLKIGPYYWNAVEPGIRIYSPWPAWVLIILMTSWTAFRIGWAPINFVNGIKAELPLKTTLLNYLYFQWYAAVAVYHYNMFRRMHQIKEFVNCMLNFNRQTAGESIL